MHVILNEYLQILKNIYNHILVVLIIKIEIYRHFQNVHQICMVNDSFRSIALRIKLGLPDRVYQILFSLISNCQNHNSFLFYKFN